ncbi:hypothetical protein AMATHDRAFT_51134 [Amanita thiersii Skay4041]|uniref:Trimethylguanosine synthase n=1 Tax=Amanita thiersii Skay4041 TaxID=703135 RepID=A0A2A9NAE4_9AGAR|nr:hypothetical protein AMATHDRAFT_51134 [Amanita thiersii Skay4041]
MGRKRKHGSGLTGLSGFVAKAFSEATTSTRRNTSQEDATSGLLEDETGSLAPLVEVTTADLSNEEGLRSIDAQTGLVQTQTQGWIEKYDATGIVPYYTDASQVPEHLKKYFYQRTRYLSLYSTPPGCLLDEEGWYSITPEVIANQIAERCRCDTILDAFCGVGGNAIAFAKTCQRVIAIDINPTRLALARHNAQIYGVADNIEFILADYIEFARAYAVRHSSPRTVLNGNGSRQIDVVFLSPPWGGPSYLAKSSSLNDGEEEIYNEGTQSFPPYSLASIQPIHGAELFHLSRKITPNIAYYLPRNTRMEEVSGLLRTNNDQIEQGAGHASGKQKKKAEEMIEVEEEWTGSKLKALTCYFGGLASGQEDMF